LEVVFVNYKYDKAFCEAFGNHVRKLREKKGITMRQFAMEADIEYSQLSKIERGVINTTISTVLTLANTLEVDVRELFKFKFPTE
jgi:transcriptional regulator with XRE-family HTH domain